MPSEAPQADLHQGYQCQHKQQWKSDQNIENQQYFCQQRKQWTVIDILKRFIIKQSTKTSILDFLIAQIEVKAKEPLRQQLSNPWEEIKIQLISNILLHPLTNPSLPSLNDKVPHCEILPSSSSIEILCRKAVPKMVCLILDIDFYLMLLLDGRYILSYTIMHWKFNGVFAAKNWVGIIGGRIQRWGWIYGLCWSPVTIGRALSIGIETCFIGYVGGRGR